MTVRPDWYPKSPLARAVLWIVAFLVAANLLLAVVNRATGGSPGGPSSSSYATAPDGLAAYADLLTRSGHPVERLRSSPAEVQLDARTTLVVLDGALDREQAQAVAAFVDRGGRLVAGGDDPVWLTTVFAQAPTWHPGVVGAAVPVAPTADVSGVTQVSSDGPGSWTQAGATLPTLAGSTGVLLTAGYYGRGRVEFLASASPLHNRDLADADNAALGVALAGGAGRPVVFAEFVHGFGRDAGFGALPARARWALAGVAFAGLVWLVARGRRLGPPQDASRPLAPPRRLYVEAMASALARSKRRREAVAGVQRAARERVSIAGGLVRDADTDAVRTAALRIGLDEDEARGIVEEPADDADVIAAGRALAKLHSRTP